MPELNIDFEGTAQPSQNGSTQTNENKPNNGEEDVTHLHGNQTTTDITDPSPEPNGGDPNGQQPNPTTEENNNPSEGLQTGDIIDFEGIQYSVDENGNLVDDKGVIFKEAKDVQSWLATVDTDNNPSESFDINSIQDAVGTVVLGEDGQPIEFTNNAEGVKAYVESVLDIKSAELQEAAINKLYADNPMLKQFVDYVQLNGTPKGFGEIPDRSNIELDKDNVAQLEAVIKMAAQEFGNKSLSASYINYLRDSGGLYDVAKEQLDALIEKDKQTRLDIEAQAQAKREKDAIDNQNYWNSLKSIIDKRIVNGFKIPESFTKEVDGKKIVLTPNDFYNYISRPAVTLENGYKISAYQADLNKLTDEEYQSKEILDAWLMFTGGSYKDLVKMLQDDSKVQHLKLKAKEQNSNKTIKVIKKQGGKVNYDDILLS